MIVTEFRASSNFVKTIKKAERQTRRFLKRMCRKHGWELTQKQEEKPIASYTGPLFLVPGSKLKVVIETKLQ